MFRKINYQQSLPLILTAATFLGLSAITYFFITFLNFLPLREKIQIILRPADLFVGLTIYLKTSVDFAIFIGRQMKQNPGWKNRIAIETGTALGNGMGTILVLTIWTFFKEVPFLMVIMIILAAFVLFRMAQESLEEYLEEKPDHRLIYKFYLIVKGINKPLSPLIEKLLPHFKSISEVKKSFFNLLIFSVSIPFVLGLDDFAGYIPLFSIVNVFGFSIGVFFGHMILNLLLFSSPQSTVKLVKQSFVMIAGSLAFIGIGIWGFYEALRILLNFLFSA